MSGEIKWFDADSVPEIKLESRPINSPNPLGPNEMGTWLGPKEQIKDEPNPRRIFIIELKYEDAIFGNEYSQCIFLEQKKGYKDGGKIYHYSALLNPDQSAIELISKVLTVNALPLNA